MIKIALTDDHAMFRKGLTALLEDSGAYEIVIQAGNGQELLNALEKQVVDLVLLDLDMPVMDGQETLAKLHVRYPGLPVIILSMHQDEALILHLMKSGANGYLLKESDPEELETAIESVVNNGFYFNDQVSRIMLLGLTQKNILKPRKLGQSIQLTNREQEVLVEVSSGLTNQEIADKMFISTRTVEGHRKNIMEKMGVRNTAAMIICAIQQQLIDPATLKLD